MRNNLARTALLASALALAPAASGAQTATPAPKASARAHAVSEVVVTASRVDLIGRAVSASQGVVTRAAIALRPIYRPGQLLETVPGLVATVHSGESKANQYLIRGFNLDHGTDFAVFVDDMPVNRGTNAHGQGYADMNFVMPETVESLDYTKGPYYADLGDFSAVGSAHLILGDELPNQVSASVGTLNDDRLFAGGTYRLDGNDRVWGALELFHLDGPWTPPSDFNRINAALRFSHGTDADGYSLTAMYHASAGRLETDQSVYAIQDGLTGRYGVLDPTDHGKSYRASLSARYGADGPDWALSANAWWVQSTMSLFNNFTHYLLDPVSGDQEDQDEARDVYGGDVKLTLTPEVLGLQTETVFGLQQRYDDVFVDRRHTLRGDTILDYCEAPAVPGGIPTLPPPPANTPPGALDDGGFGQAYAAVGGYCYADRVGLEDLGAYAQTTIHWTGWLRTVLGLREEHFYAHDHSFTTGFTGAATQTLPQPKASLVLGPWLKSELYLSGGRGFHSNDVRGVFGTVGLEGLTPTAGPTPLLAPTTGYEVGLRSDLLPKTSIQLALFREDFSSELLFDEDQGEDQPTAPSRREGLEVSGQYRPLPWMELSTDLAFARARYQGSAAELSSIYQLPGDAIANAPGFIGSAGVLIDHLGPWYGDLQWRALGSYPVVDGQTYPRDPGYSEINIDAGYKVDARLKVAISLFNLTDQKADAAAFDYTSRLTPTSAPVTGLQVHPLEPLSARLSATVAF